MNCLRCGASMETGRENYAYTACGLSSVTLHQVEVSQCPHCGESEVAIPQIAGLHRALAEALMRKPVPLTLAETRFLQKEQEG